MARWSYGLLLFVVATDCGAEPSPKQVIERALKACGVESYEQDWGFRSIWAMVEDAKEREVAGYFAWVASTRGQKGQMSFITTDDAEVERIDLDGAKVQHRTNAVVRPGGPQNELWKSLYHIQKTAWLIPMLQDKQYKLTIVGKSARNDHPCIGLLAKYPGFMDVKLFFHEKTGRLYESLGKVVDGKTTQTILCRYQNYKTHNPLMLDVKVLVEADIPMYGREPERQLRRLTQAIPSLQKRKQLVQQLGARSFKKRAQAMAEIRKLGPACSLWLARYQSDPDQETARRAQELLKEGMQNKLIRHLPSLIRVVGASERPEAVGPLLEILSHRPPPEIKVAIQSALFRLAKLNGKPNPLMVAALNGPEPQRTAVAVALKKQKPPAGASPQRLNIPVTVAHTLLVGETDDDGNGFKPSMEMELQSLEVYEGVDPRWFKETHVLKMKDKLLRKSKTK